MHYTTKQDILDHDPCYIPDALADAATADETVSFKQILDSTNIKDAVWCLRTLSYKETCLFRADVAELVVHLTEGDAARLAIQTIRDRHAGMATDKQLSAASSAGFTDAAATATASAAHASATYAAASAYTTYVAAYAAASAASAAAYVAAYAAAYAAATASASESESAYVAAYAAATAASESAAAAAAASAMQDCWEDIEKLFVKHFC